MSDMCTDNPMSCYSNFYAMKIYRVVCSYTGDEKEVRADKPIEAVQKYLKTLGVENANIKRSRKEEAQYFVGKYGYITY